MLDNRAKNVRIFFKCGISYNFFRLVHSDIHFVQVGECVLFCSSIVRIFFYNSVLIFLIIIT